MAKPQEAPRLRVTWCGKTDTGRVRRNNEDTLWAGRVGDATATKGNAAGAAETPFPGLLFAVADGMGGALAGEVASGLAVSTLATEMARRATEAASATPERQADLLKGAVEAANACIRAEGDSNPHRSGMGTTLTAVWLGESHAHIAQVGDSRAYLFRSGHLQQLTKDQSLVGKLIEDGIITEADAERMAGRNIILQALGTDEPLDVVHQRERLEAGDCLLLCTDGLSGVLGNGDLESELRKGGSPETLCDRLTALANQRGGPDNITVLIVRTERG
jgi:serine/threonine protein phosphatase PrpC